MLESLFNKVQGRRPATLLKRDSNTGFPVNIFVHQLLYNNVRGLRMCPLDENYLDAVRGLL